MPQSNKKEVEKAPGAKATARGQQGRRSGFIIGAVVIIVILVILGGGYYQNYVVPFQRTIITVDDTTIRMDYFLKRTGFSGTDPISMLERLTNEQLIKLEAPRYGIAVSPEDIIQELRSAARGESETIAESEFQEWYRQQLNDSRLSDAEYKEIVATSLLAARLQEYLAERMPTVAEQVHLHAILLGTSAEAQKIKERLDKGEAFTDLAREVSLDEESKAGGGDLGWLPRGFLDPRFEDAAFNLKLGEVSTPIAAVAPSPPDEGTEEGGYYLLMVSEKVEAREVAAEYLPTLKSRALEFWLTEEIHNHKIDWNFNSEINAWINWQIAKNQPSITGQQTTPSSSTGQEPTQHQQ